ncbi:hypothetical protein evm_015530, partial [Chilo suppressalis]
MLELWEILARLAIRPPIMFAFRNTDAVERTKGSHWRLLFFLKTKYENLVKNMIQALYALGCKMSLKIHILDSHLDFCPENMGNVSDEHGERFHQDISGMEQRYQGKWSPAMLADYCWTLKREAMCSVEELALHLFDAGAVRLGDIEAKQGRRTPVYFDLRVVVSHPTVMAWDVME